MVDAILAMMIPQTILDHMLRIKKLDAGSFQVVYQSLHNVRTSHSLVHL